MTERDPKELTEGLTRAELRAAEEAEEEKNPGYLARTRKATMSGACALATALSGAVLVVTQDGTLTTEEMLGSLIISVGVGASVWLATWATPNA